MTPNESQSKATHLRLARRSPRCTVLGPGTRAVLWVQGCPFRCPGCVAPETLPFEGGEVVEVDALARELLALSDVEGVTFSGGEPMSQPAALAALIDHIREKRDLSFLSYTGFTIDQLAQGGTAAQQDLLKRLDILIDGPYVASRHTDKRWRGSDNQRVLFLTPRHRDWAERIDERVTGIEFEVLPDGVAWMGIPPPGFREAFEKAMAQQGLRLAVKPS
jgi:anaerobic ribonucleoside-triphosphate reductase activating protein